MAQHEIRKQKAFTVQLLKPLPQTTEKQLKKPMRIEIDEYDRRYHFEIGRHIFSVNQKEFNSMISGGWIKIITETYKEFYVIGSHKVTLRSDRTIGIGCQSVNFNDVLCIASWIKAQQNKIEFEIPEHLFRSIGKLKAANIKRKSVSVVKPIPGLEVGLEIHLTRDESLSHEVAWYGTINYDKYQVRTLIKDGWLTKNSEVIIKTSLQFDGSELYMNGKREVHVGSYKVPADIILGLAAEIIKRTNKTEEETEGKKGMTAKTRKDNLFTIGLVNKLQALGFKAKGLKSGTEVTKYTKE